MNLLVSLFFSLLLTTLVSFATPIVLCTFVLAILAMVSYIPILGIGSDNLYEQIWNFLGVFGEGSGSIGLLTISFACAIAGFLFESLNFYRYHILIQHPIKWTKKVPEMICKIKNEELGIRR